MPLQHLIKQRDLDAPGSIIEADAGARAAPADLVNQARDPHLPSAGECAYPRNHGRPLGDEVADAVRDEVRQMRLDALDGMAGEIQAEGLAFSRQALGVAPVRLG